MKLHFNMPFALTAEQELGLRAVCAEATWQVSDVADPDTLGGEGVEVLVTELVPRDLSHWPDLRWVQLLSAGSDQVWQHPVWERGIPVTNASGIHSVPIAQYITVTWLMMVHRMTALLEFKHTREWPDRGALANRVVRGMTVGIIGYGAVGRECARQLSALGMRVQVLKRQPEERAHLGYNPYPDSGDPGGTLPEAWHGPEQLAEFLPTCDLVVVTVPRTAWTDGLIGETELRLMRPDARLIVISRGGIVQEAALARALRESWIAEAAVDCFVTEPLPPDHAFFDVPNLLLTPHMSGVVDAYWPVLFGLVTENLCRLQQGEALCNMVSPTAGY
jgi:phosphoglycerate dehydrogenase-like enzyme